MDDREFEKILASAEQLRLREKQAEPWTDRYSDMNSMEKSMLLDELFALRKADKEREAKLLEKLDRMTEQLMNLNESSQMQMKQNEELKQMIADLQKQNELLKKENAALKEQKKQDRKNLYGSKSQKISRKKKEEAPSHEENKDDFDGTSGPSSVSASDEDALSQAPEKKEERPYRKGMSYRRMKADKSVCHDSDFSRLPKDAVIIKTFYKYSYQQISYILEHKYQVIRYKQSDGKIREGYFPKAGEPDYIDVVPGTHASADFLAHLAFNHFVLNVPYYREMYRLSDHKMSLSRMTLVNWLAKGDDFTSALIERLKDRAMVKDSIVNCDETWCKVKMNRHFLKKYVWCLVNKEQKIVIYCYEDGSRGRKVLKGILKDRQVKALQSDGYNVYMYIDKELVDTEHLCCLAHARAKFVLPPTHSPRGELMDKAVNYLQVFWKQLFAYLNDGRYDIDNSIAERFIRPLAGERKNSLFFVGSRMANVSAAYHTLLSTCRMNGLSALEYLKKFFHEIVKGRKDYENLLPMTIGINTNKY